MTHPVVLRLSVTQSEKAFQNSHTNSSDSMSIRPLSATLQKLAESELYEVPERISEDISHIKEWLQRQPHLNARTDDQLILSFLRGCKFSLEKCKQKLESYYTFKTLLPEYFNNRDPFLSEIQEILKQGCYWLPLPKSEGSPQVLYLSTESLNPETADILNVIKVNFMIFDILMNEDDNFVVSGHQLFHNLKGVSMGHVMQVTPSIIKKTSACLHDVYPLRPKGLHFINVPTAFETIVRPFLLGKNGNRIKVSNGSYFGDLYSVISKEALPVELGGENGNLTDLIDLWKTKVESYREWFLNDAQYCSNESKRVGKPKSVGDVFGIDGSFRKLDVD
ncbi:hypothetical protein PPYR_09507 [Photinus pyralis]|uniref:CRAL-TRIO domain-containing protein n=1 Tax=Photinus pyralis TaxID=7054 RepID=A0A5N4AMH8_PHOPY|nr:retinol-binding protein pinta-like isoform X2 [Photinus pyralis]KAB0798514.1 hypothetical protein PPYR_09507 [Photinus pyralis]